MNILIRSDSSSQIGLGHIMRDLVLAKRFEEDKVMFACQNLQGNIIHKIPYPTHILSSNSHEELIELIKKLQIDMIVFDHYGIDDSFEKKIKEATGVKILSFDDMYKKHYCDILLNHNISANPKRYKELVPKNCELWCGSKYTLIRDEFIQEKRKKRKKEGIFICLGGSDSKNITLKVIKKLKDKQLKVVTTSSNPNLKTLKRYISSHKNIKLFIDSNEVATLLNSSKFAIITPSVIAHESLFLKVPFCAIQTASNQKDVHKYLKRKRLSRCKSSPTKGLSHVHKYEHQSYL